ncbi:hypothetical protein Q428_08830 [Fervidicella metallireducens AeB]|uniref:Uncharacterized protein n=1 Tax=Fervidicella metallireducens AeB TaxID=1403537 RepID=A0A017RWI3_9CLOT|nr:hypothetical protein [Fervidicella metallireducens]EYE88295.1 hypothetical protein Q428_08830 [Fervidicella metallireducens AeB]
MPTLSSKDVASRLNDTFMKNFACMHYKVNCKHGDNYIKKNNISAEELAFSYIEQLKVFIDLFAISVKDNFYIADLILISDPFVIFSFDYVFKKSMELLTNQKSDVYYDTHDNDVELFKKYSLIYLESK